MSDAPTSPSDDSPNPFTRPTRDYNPALNPYAPTVDVGAAVDESDVEVFRNHYLKHEASIKSLGLLYLIPGGFLLVGGVVALALALISLVTAGAGFQTADQVAGLLIGICLYGGLGTLYCYTGIGLRRFWPSARIIGSIFSVLGLLAVPIGTLISGYFLYLLVSEKGRIVFSEPYQEAIRQTPHIKYKTPLLVKVLAGILLLLIFVLFAVALFTG